MTNTSTTNETAAPFAVVSIDVGGSKIAGAIVEYATPESQPDIPLRQTISTNALEGGDAVLRRIVRLACQLIDDYEGDIRAVGIATTGRVEADTGSIGVVLADNIMPGWSHQPVASAVSAATSKPCAVLNDVQGHALGEARWGAARGRQNCIMVAPGTGLGGSFIVNGKLVRGSRGFAGEIGHTFTPYANDIPCPCGGTSHLESIASGSGIEARYAEASGNALPGPQISELAYRGDEIAKRVIQTAGFALGASIASWVNMFDPEIIVLSGSVLKAGALWFDELKAGYRSQVSAADYDLEFAEATLGSDAPLYGAAEHACDTFNLR